jgi:hypothetical protein
MLWRRYVIVKVHALGIDAEVDGVHGRPYCLRRDDMPDDVDAIGGIPEHPCGGAERSTTFLCSERDCECRQHSGDERRGS